MLTTIVLQTWYPLAGYMKSTSDLSKVCQPFLLEDKANSLLFPVALCNM